MGSGSARLLLCLGALAGGMGALSCGSPDLPPEPAPDVPECVNDDRTPPEGAPEVTTIGRSLGSRFTPLEDGAQLPLEFGIQGGQHVIVAARFYGRDGGVWRHTLTLTSTASGKEMGWATHVFAACTPGWVEARGVLVFVETATVTGGRLTLETEALDEAREPIRMLKDEVSIRIRREE